MRIHEMVSRGNFPNCSTIARELEVNRKTIQRDLNFMRDELELPLEYSEASHGYHYTRPVSDFPLFKTRAEDLVGLIFARNALGGMRGSALEASLRTGFQRMLAGMSDRVTIPWSDLDQAFSAKSVGLTEQDAFVLDRLASAVLESRELHFEYRKLKDAAPSKRRIQPYHLAEIDGGWYVIGHDLDRDARRTFAVQRMRAVHLTTRRFLRSRDFRLDDHFAGSFGVWAGEDRGAPAYRVRIRFHGFAARVVAERRWHPSQEIAEIEPGGEVIEIAMTLSALEDIARWVLGFGGQAEALEPPELRERVAAELRRAVARYPEG
ncbi:MAG TPA: WYL domain-containing transcriptional regulator [Bacteroidia bacterium]|nr:WYL domain-containing transcriptional regulator [Bacteroidia bacterium]